MLFTTERLTVRAMEENDFEATLGYRLNQDVHQYLPFPVTMEFAKERFDHAMTPWKGGDGDKLAVPIILTQTQELIGELMFKYVDKSSGVAEIGYCLNPNYQGKGFAKESVKGLIDYSFSHFKVHKLMAVIDAGNEASFRLVESLGMKREAHFREHYLHNGNWCDLYNYGMLLSDRGA